MWASAGFALIALIALVGACGASTPEPAPLFTQPSVAVADVDVDAAPLPRPPPPPTASVLQPRSDPAPATSATAGALFAVSPGSAPSASASSTPAGPPKALDANTAAEAIALLRPSFQKCLRDQLAITPGISGTMNLDVEIKADGSVGTIKPQAVTGIPTPVVTCVTQVVQAARFPLPANGKPTPLTIPIAFTR